MSDQSSSPASSSVLVRCSECLVLNRVPQQKLMERPVCGKCKAGLEVPTEPVFVRADAFDRTVTNWPETLLVVFTRQMCLHCKIIDPVLKELARDRAGKLKILTVDTELDPSLVQRFNVERTPTFVVYKGGQDVLRFDGPPKEKSELIKWVDNMIAFTSY